jgi:intein-encoded DNA endonuclease-like protein
MKISKEELEQKYAELKSIKAVANFYNLDPQNVRYYFATNNLNYDQRKVYSYDHNFFLNDTERNFYWAGFIAGDACISKSSNNIKIKLAEKDSEILEKLKIDIKTDKEIYHYDSKNPFGKNGFSKDCSFHIRSPQMKIDLLNRFGIITNKSLTHSIPNRILNHEYFNHFLRGLFDADGCYCCENNKASIYLVGSQVAMNQIFLFLIENKIIKTGDLRSQGKIDKISIRSLEDNFRLINFMFKDSTIYLARKKIIVDQILSCRPKYKKKLLASPELFLNNLSSP